MKSIHFILASGSARRKELLSKLNFPFEVMVPNIDETFNSNLSLENNLLNIAFEKANYILQSLKENHDTIVISADTVVIQNDNILGKPKNKTEAIKMLLKLSGREHTVATSFCILSQKKKITNIEYTKVYFKTLSLEEINYYIDLYNPYDKAGAYGIQEWIGMIGIEKIDGDYYNVMGLPMRLINEGLKNMKKKS